MIGEGPLLQRFSESSQNNPRVHIGSVILDVRALSQYQQQRNVLVQLGCQCGQGWYCEKDQPLERLHGLPVTFGPPVVASPEGA